MDADVANDEFDVVDFEEAGGFAAIRKRRPAFIQQADTKEAAIAKGRKAMAFWRRHHAADTDNDF